MFAGYGSRETDDVLKGYRELQVGPSDFSCFFNSRSMKLFHKHDLTFSPKCT